MPEITKEMLAAGVTAKQLKKAYYDADNAYEMKLFGKTQVKLAHKLKLIPNHFFEDNSHQPLMGDTLFKTDDPDIIGSINEFPEVPCLDYLTAMLLCYMVRIKYNYVSRIDTAEYNFWVTEIKIGCETPEQKKPETTRFAFTVKYPHTKTGYATVGSTKWWKAFFKEFLTDYYGDVNLAEMLDEEKTQFQTTLKNIGDDTYIEISYYVDNE